MSDEVSFLPFDKAKKMVGNVIEEEHLRENNRRILTVYDLNGQELCWFDAEEVMAAVGVDPNKKLNEQQQEDFKIAAVDYVLNRIPDWVIEG